MDLKIIDCTIRDGGHLNKWNFDPICVRSSYFAALSSGTDYFEIGYRSSKLNLELGPFAYCEDAFLTQLLNPVENCKLTVMIDAGKCSNEIFVDKRIKHSPIVAIRVAAYPYEIEKALQLIENFYDKGYEVFLNLMASSELTQKEFEKLSAWNNKSIINALYFADSFGSFVPSDIPRFVDKFQQLGFKSIGFHPHNNLQLSFANVLRAIEENVTYIDASIYGMGRGSGNLPIEIIIGYLEKKGGKKYNTVPYLDLIERYYVQLSKELKWGYTLESLLGGLINIHPYYVRSVMQNKYYTIDETWNALQLIKDKCPVSFSEENLDQTLGSRFYKPLTEEIAKEICKTITNEINLFPASDVITTNPFPYINKYQGKKFLIIATGPSIIKYKDIIDNIIKSNEYIIIGVNNLQNLYIPHFHVFISRKRFQQYISTVSTQSVIFIPSFFGMEFVKNITDRSMVFFNIISPCEFNSIPLKECTQYCATLNVSISAILLAVTMGAKEINVVGMDGYVDEYNKKFVYFYNENNEVDDKNVASMRYELLANELDRVNRFLQNNSVPFYIRTPTTHKKFFKNF